MKRLSILVLAFVLTSILLLTSTKVKAWSPEDGYVSLDDTPPTTLLTIGEPKYVEASNTYVTNATSFTLEATDNLGGSGLNKTAYKINSTNYDSGWLNYTNIPFYLDQLKNGNYTLAYNSTDNAGNVEQTNLTNITLVRAYDCPGDVTGDGKCNLTDLVALAKVYRTQLGDLNWNPILDFNEDSNIGLCDLVTVGWYWTS